MSVIPSIRICPGARIREWFISISYNDIEGENSHYLTCSGGSLVTRAVDTASNVSLSPVDTACATNDSPMDPVIDSIVST